MDDGALPSRWAAYERRVPSSLEDLRGQATGLVELPLHVAWSGRRVYDVGEDDQRLVLYALLLAEAQREDLERFVHRESLVSMWPRLAAAAGSARPPGVGAEADDDGLPVSLEGLPAAHLRVLLDGLPVFERYGLLLAGGICVPGP